MYFLVFNALMEGFSAVPFHLTTGYLSLRRLLSKAQRAPVVGWRPSILLLSPIDVQTVGCDKLTQWHAVDVDGEVHRLVVMPRLFMCLGLP